MNGMKIILWMKPAVDIKKNGLLKTVIRKTTNPYLSDFRAVVLPDKEVIEVLEVR